MMTGILFTRPSDMQVIEKQATHIRERLPTQSTAIQMSYAAGATQDFLVDPQLSPPLSVS
jgi:hypothetical protein